MTIPNNEVFSVDKASLDPAPEAPPAAALPAGRRGGPAPLRVRRPHRLSPAAARRLPAGKRGAGHRRAACLSSTGRAGRCPGAGTGLSGGAMPHAQGVVLSLARFNRIRAHDSAGPPGRRPARRAQPRGVGSSSAARPLLRARSVFANCLHAGRQRCREFGRRALPEVRADRA